MKLQTVNPDNRGVTLVEVMIALVITLVVFMGLIQASLLSIESNLNNEIRDEAVRIGAEQMSAKRSLSWNNVTNWSTVVSRPFRSLTQNYSVSGTVNTLDANNKEVTVSVVYSNRGVWNTILFASMLRQQQ